MLLSSMSLDSFVFLRFSAPFSFFLCLYEDSAIIMLRAFLSPVLAYVPIEGWIVHLVLLKSCDVLV